MNWEALAEAERVSMMATYWHWLHWGQWASSNSPEDLTELEHVVQVLYAIPAMKAMREESPGAQRLDPKFRRFVEECLARGAASASVSS